MPGEINTTFNGYNVTIAPYSLFGVEFVDALGDLLPIELRQELFVGMLQKAELKAVEGEECPPPSTTD
jgi:hypothetical protein